MSEDLAAGPLADVLSEARAAGFLGPGPLDIQIRHAEGFAAVARRAWDQDPGPVDGDGPSLEPLVLDLGSGGGLPGLVVAERWPEARLVLLEAQGRRAAFLARSVTALGLEARVEVRQERAEEFGRAETARGSFDLVLARSFGAPAVVAECGAPLLQVGGRLVVSEPPEQTDDEAAARWPSAALGQLGLVPEERARAEFEYRVLRLAAVCPKRYPRRTGVPAKRPLF